MTRRPARSGPERVSPAPSPASVLRRKCVCGAHTPGGETCGTCTAKQGGLQRKLAVGRTDDPLEAEADRMADAAMAGHALARSGQVAHTVRRRAAADEESASEVPDSVVQTLASAGAPLGPAVRGEMENRFGHDFSHVRLYSDASAAQSARDVHAAAYTAGNQIVFGQGQLAPNTSAGRHLLAHELAHVVQQGDAGIVRRKAPSIGTKFSHPAGAKSTFKAVSASFDGQDFVVKDGSTTILSHPAQSGKPVTVRAGDVASCKGVATDTYLNNARYIGIKDFGAIPEGTFSFNLDHFATFSAAEQVSMITGGNFTDPFGSALHGGDWGSGRAPLRPKTLLKAGCGNTAARSGFFLHGGSLPGSSGCIDIDNDGIDSLLKNLAGYKSDIEVTVKYTKAAPSVGGGTRALGRFTYPTTKDGKPIKDPSIVDRFGSLLGGDDSETQKEEPTQPKSAPKPAPPKKKTKPKEKPKTPKKKKKSALLQRPLDALFALIDQSAIDEDDALALLDDFDSDIEEEEV